MNTLLERHLYPQQKEMCYLGLIKSFMSFNEEQMQMVKKKKFHYLLAVNPVFFCKAVFTEALFTLAFPKPCCKVSVLSNI